VRWRVSVGSFAAKRKPVIVSICCRVIIFKSIPSLNDWLTCKEDTCIHIIDSAMSEDTVPAGISDSQLELKRIASKAIDVYLDDNVKVAIILVVCNVSECRIIYFEVGGDLQISCVALHDISKSRSCGKGSCWSWDRAV
jgi:hypothetical protein